MKKKEKEKASQDSVQYLVVLLWHISLKLLALSVPCCSALPNEWFQATPICPDEAPPVCTHEYSAAAAPFQTKLWLLAKKKNVTQSESDGGENVDTPAAAVTVFKPS